MNWVECVCHFLRSVLPGGETVITRIAPVCSKLELGSTDELYQVFIKHIFNSFYQNIYRKMETPEMKVIPILLKWKLWQQESDSGYHRRIISRHILDI